LIILRRFFAIAAALYFLRSLTMVFTSLPVATAITDCRPDVYLYMFLLLISINFFFLLEIN